MVGSEGSAALPLAFRFSKDGDDAVAPQPSAHVDANAWICESRVSECISNAERVTQSQYGAVQGTVNECPDSVYA